METSSKGLELIKQHEGCRLRAYKCPSGVWTVGYGSTRGVNQWTEITRQEAEVRLREDVKTAERTVEKVRYLQPRLTQNQFDALVSFVFNLGSGNFEKSTLRKKVLADPSDESIRAEFLKWTHSNGKPLTGLQKRRKAEADLYFS
jgi:phage lysozyme|nr:MAG TPA: Lysozyme [Caudoviricetes sp.]